MIKKLLLILASGKLLYQPIYPFDFSVSVLTIVSIRFFSLQDSKKVHEALFFIQ